MGMECPLYVMQVMIYIQHEYDSNFEVFLHLSIDDYGFGLLGLKNRFSRIMRNLKLIFLIPF